MEHPRRPATQRGDDTVELYVLDTGLIESSDFAIWSPSVPPGTHREMSVRSFLVVHPDGVLLWDTGSAEVIQPVASQLARFRCARLAICR